MAQMNRMKAQAQYIRQALEMGATSAVGFDISQIAFDSRTLLKCMYGCSDWGKLHTCPSRPGNPSLAEYKEMFSRYQWGIIIHAHDKKTTQTISYEIERQAFFQGYYFAFSLSDCGLCKECAGLSEEPCRFVQKARPAFHSVGIDVFKTVHRLNLPLSTLREKGEEQNWYAAVFIE